MIVLDTHAWLWWLIEPRRLSRRAARAIERADRLGVATMSIVELVELIQRGRIHVDTATRSWVRDALMQRVEPLVLTTEIALDAAQLGFVGDRADRIIYATARAEDARLVTRDEQMHAFDPERVVW